MLRKIVVTMLCLAGWLSSAALAGVISYTSSFNGATLPFGSLGLTLPQFNGPADQLRSILFIFQGNVGGALRFENLSNDRVSVSLTGGGVFDLDRPFSSVLAISGPAVSNELAAFDGALDFFGDSSWSGTSEKVFLVSERLLNQSQFAPYTGPGNFTFNLSANPSSSVVADPGQSLAFLSTVASGTLTVSYFTVSEPGSLLLTGLSLLALGRRLRCDSASGATEGSRMRGDDGACSTGS